MPKRASGHLLLYHLYEGWWEWSFQQQSLFRNFRRWDFYSCDFRGLFFVNRFGFINDKIEAQSNSNMCKVWVSGLPNPVFSIFCTTDTHLWQLQWSSHWQNLSARLCSSIESILYNSLQVTMPNLYNCFWYSFMMALLTFRNKIWKKHFVRNSTQLLLHLFYLLFLLILLHFRCFL